MEMVSIRTRIGWVMVPSALGVAVMAGFVAPASAAQMPAVHIGSAVHTAATRPNTNIKGSPATWNPTKLTASPIKKGTTCSGGNYSFSIANKTTKPKTILYKTRTSPKKLLSTLKAGVKLAVCATGPKGAVFKLFIKGATSVLTVTLS
jgi:hypothetical protein